MPLPLCENILRGKGECLHSPLGVENPHATYAASVPAGVCRWKKGMERAAGIEPASLAWKAKVLPLHNAR